MSAVPPVSALAGLLDAHAPLSKVPLCPELRAFRAHGLVEVWAAAESLAGRTLDAPFWAWPWAAGQALARLVLDEPHRVRGRTVLDFGAGGGVASLACARAGAARVIANDIDPWAIAVTRIAAERQGLDIETLAGDLTDQLDCDAVRSADVVLCSDLSYDRRSTPRERALLDHARARGATLLVADAGRAYFDPTGLQRIVTYEVPVPVDLEGRKVRLASVYEAEAGAFDGSV